MSALAQEILQNLLRRQARMPANATCNDWYMAVSFTVRDRMIENWVRCYASLLEEGRKVVSYLSAEFLPGPHLGNNLLNLGIEAPVREALDGLGVRLEDLLEHEEEPGLGNGGLGRLAACFMDSLATLRVPAFGYGIRYEFGIFDQEIRDGEQVEKTDKWLHLGNPWEVARPDHAYYVGLGGRTGVERSADGGTTVRWEPARMVKGVAHDTPISGYRTGGVSVLRLWRSEAVESFDFQAFNVGDYYKAVEEKIASETVGKILYPNDERETGRYLRLVQQYFFVSCSLQDMIRMHRVRGRPLGRFPEAFAIQLNDTHPSLAVAELMRLLVDEHGMGWDEAWEVTRRSVAYTNHTLLPEALERWSLPLFAKTLPRHLEIVYEINRRFLDGVRARCPGDEARVARLSLIDEEGERSVRMAHLAVVGSHAVNGVAELHSRLLGETVLRDFKELWPDRFRNVTNGVTPRRFVALANPGLARLLTERLGDRWPTDPAAELPRLEGCLRDRAFREEWRRVRAENKALLAGILRERCGVRADPASLFDVQVKRIHEYKRQHLNVLHLVSLWLRMKEDRSFDPVPRTAIFAGKAAPGYRNAKLVIRLIHGVADAVNGDPDVRGRLKIAFLPDFNVKRAARIYPAADLSEQISTAGKEASGTGNMKFMMNGALTIGTLDGANAEIREEAGEENFFLFGLTAEEAAALRARGHEPRRLYESQPLLRASIDAIAEGRFSRGDREAFAPLVTALLGRDEFLLLADFASYVGCQARVEEAWRDRERWTAMSVRNTARSGKFSSDRSIRDYCDRIWGVPPPP